MYLVQKIQDVADFILLKCHFMMESEEIPHPSIINVRVNIHPVSPSTVLEEWPQMTWRALRQSIHNPVQKHISYLFDKENYVEPLKIEVMNHGWTAGRV